MSPSVAEVEAQRARWVRYRENQGLVSTASSEFARGGLARHVEDLDIRVMFLPADPEEVVVLFDSNVLARLVDRPGPYAGTPVGWGHREHATSSALVRYDQYREDRGWTRYLALHRHGGLEGAATLYAHEAEGTRIFHLRGMVALVWTLAALQAEAVITWAVPGPLEFVMALRNTKGATLGHFAEGWAEFGRDYWDSATCLDDSVLLRWKLETDFDPETLALEAGNRLEQSFGTTQRRHLASRGAYQGLFDPRF
jgi:hypothetical protein